MKITQFPKAGILPALCFLLLLGSCTRPEDAPEFRYVENVKVSSVSDKEAFLNADAVFYNPNDVSMTLRGVDVDVLIEGREVGRIEHFSGAC
ncbi:MAG: hypothetical protein P8X57_15040 [Cyclobacteriaceae bacterium]